MGPWTQSDIGHPRREVDYEIEYLDLLRRTLKAGVSDHQTVDSATEHLLYVVSDRKTPWHLPYRKDFNLLTKVVITHVAKSKCKLALYTKVDWNKPHIGQGLINHRALYDLEQDALDLADVVSDQCRRLGEKARTKKAITVFGQVGLQTQVSEFAGSESPLSAQLRRSMKPRSFARLVLEAVGSMLETIATSTLQILTDLVQWTWKTLSANKIILGILILSVLANLIFTTKTASDSWRERRALKYMSRLGIGPDLTMTKTIFLQDIDEASSFNDDVEHFPSLCRSTFDSTISLHADSPDEPGSSQTSIYDRPPLGSPSSSRLQRTRQVLGSQRHDLVVAMRVVNSIEREIVQAEWEHWVIAESSKCKHVGAMLRRNSSEASALNNRKQQQVLKLDNDPKEIERVQQRYDSYCGSCKEEMLSLGVSRQ